MIFSARYTVVLLELKENTEELLSYFYYPESWDAQPGVLAVEKGTGENRVVLQSPDDNWFEYRVKGFSQIHRMMESENILEKCSNVWY